VEVLDEMAADEAGAASDEDAHGVKFERETLRGR
jgi:hypothetical protein